jgi:hypothetical protein
LLDTVPNAGFSRKSARVGWKYRKRYEPHKLSSQNNVLQWPKTGSSLFCNGPLNLLGGGSWKWPGAGQLDGKTLAKIRRSEVGGEWMLPPEESSP